MADFLTRLCILGAAVSLALYFGLKHAWRLASASENKVEGFDHARTTFADIPSENGGYMLDIPLKWGIEGGPYSYDAGHVLQTTSIQTDGTVTVSKFGITAMRKPNEDYQ